jgi:hypothetical protein
MTRIEHCDDRDAPPANSLVPAASGVVQDEAGAILLIRRSDNRLWSIAGRRDRGRRDDPADRGTRDQGRDRP